MHACVCIRVCVLLSLYETLELSVLGHYLPTSLVCLKKTVLILFKVWKTFQSVTVEEYYCNKWQPLYPSYPQEGFSWLETLQNGQWTLS